MVLRLGGLKSESSQDDVALEDEVHHEEAKSIKELEDRPPDRDSQEEAKQGGVQPPAQQERNNRLNNNEDDGDARSQGSEHNEESPAH